MQRPRCLGPGARRLFFWSSGLALGIQVLLNLFIEIRHTEVYDPEYRDRLILLRQRIAEEPGRPLLLVVGSSRITTDFLPEVLPPLRTPGGERVLPFNFSHTGAGPLLNLTQVRRLIREGIVPRWVVIEVAPVLLGVTGHSAVAHQAQAGDLPVLRRYMNPWKLYGYYCWERLAACCNHRGAFLRHCLPWLSSPSPTWDVMPLGPLGGTTRILHPEVGFEAITGGTAGGSGYFSGMEDFQVHETADRATRELLALCREHGIEAMLLLAPEAQHFRNRYPPVAQRVIDSYCATLSREYGVPVADTRGWLADHEFSDGHHILTERAGAFTLRLGREVLQPLVEGRSRVQGIAAVASGSGHPSPATSRR